MTSVSDTNQSNINYEFEFTRDRLEHVRVMYSITYWALGQGKAKTFSIKNIVIWVVVFLVALAVFQALDAGLLPPNYVFPFFVGVAVAGALALLFFTVFNRMTEQKLTDVLLPDKTIKVIVDDIGIRSNDGELLIETPWENVCHLANKDNRITVFSDLLSHYIPRRAVPAELNFDTLYEHINSAVMRAGRSEN